MDGRISLYLFVLYLLYSSIRAGGLVAAEPDVCAWIVTPEADRKESGRAELRCIATNLQSNHIVEFSDKAPSQVAFDHHYLTSTFEAGRFTYETTQTGDRITTSIAIADLHRGDTGKYFCYVCETTGGLKILITTSSVVLSVLYFPGESFPVCSPEGAVAVDAGMELNLQCSSESGNAAVMVEVSQTPTRCAIYPWTSCSNDSVSATSLSLTVDAADEGTAFECTISSRFFPDTRHSCTIGPIRVRNVSQSATELTTELQPEMSSAYATEPVTGPASTSVTFAKDVDKTGQTGPISASSGPPSTTSQPPLLDETRQPSSAAPWKAAFLVAIALLAVSVTINILLAFRVLKPKRMPNGLFERETQLPDPASHIELQTMETTLQHTVKLPEENVYDGSEIE